MGTATNLLLSAVLGVVIGQPHQTIFAEEKPTDTLTRHEKLTIQEIVFKGVAIATVYPDPETKEFPRRKLVIDKDLIAVYKTKKVATLEYLLEIVKIGRASDSYTAAAMAKHLEKPDESPGTLIGARASKLDDYDKPTVTELSPRQIEIKSLTKLIEELKKK